jgi:hypothetical protein
VYLLEYPLTTNIADQEHWRLTDQSGSAGKEGSSVCCMRLVYAQHGHELMR